MLRRARIALALFALASLCASPALFADDGNTNPDPGPVVQEGGDQGDALAWLLWLLGLGDKPNDEFNPQHLPGG